MVILIESSTYVHHQIQYIIPPQSRQPDQCLSYSLYFLSRGYSPFVIILLEAQALIFLPTEPVRLFESTALDQSGSEYLESME